MAALFGCFVLAAFIVGLVLIAPGEFLIALPVTFIVMWAVGAVIHDDWWPFRYL